MKGFELFLNIALAILLFFILMMLIRGLLKFTFDHAKKAVKGMVEETFFAPLWWLLVPFAMITSLISRLFKKAKKVNDFIE